jgi:flavin-dependent dehydrogenase
MPEVCCDILIVGGGPAGSASALRLAQLGHDVCLLERKVFPRPHVGESLSGGVRAQLEFLGVADVLRSMSSLHFEHAEIDWSGAAFECKPMHSNSFTVDRAHFDRVLLGAAQRSGVRVFQPATARAAQRRPSVWIISAEANGVNYSISAKFIIDASGRAGFLPRQRIETSSRTLALYGYWRGTKLPEVPRIEAGPRQWYWGSPVPGRGFNAMVFVDRDTPREGGMALPRHYHGLIEASRLLAGADAAQLDGAVFGCDATSFEDSQYQGDGFIKVGEAAFAIDPLSSSGVQVAIQSALAGSVVVHTILANPNSTDVAQRFYAQHVKNESARHAALAVQHYGDHRRYCAEAFWQRRATRPRSPLVTTRSEAVRRRWRADHHVALSRDIKVDDVPSVVGDFVVLRSAVSHPALSRPVAFLGGLDLPAFLDRMPPVVRVCDLERALASVLSRDRVPAVLAWLLDHGLLEETGRSALALNETWWRDAAWHDGEAVEQRKGALGIPRV